MEETKSKKISVFSIISIIVIVILIVGLVLMFWNNKKLNDQIIKLKSDDIRKSSLNTTNISNEFSNELNQSTEQLQNETNTYSENQEIASTTIYKTQALNKLSDLYLESDSEHDKAKKIAKSFENAVNNKDWYYLYKLCGTKTDLFIEYDIHNYKVDIDNSYNLASLEIENSEHEFIFDETFDWDKTKAASIDGYFGGMLIIEFENNEPSIAPLCTGW